MSKLLSSQWHTQNGGHHFFFFFPVSKSRIVNISDFSGYVDFFATSQFCHFRAKTAMTNVKQVSYVSIKFYLPKHVTVPELDHHGIDSLFPDPPF